MNKVRLLRQVTTTREGAGIGEIACDTCKESELFLLPSERPVTWQGFGVCLNEMCLHELDLLPEALSSAVLDELFLPERMNLNFLRLPIGANDFALDWYSYDETDGDFALSDFSIERDKEYVLRFAKEALARNPEAKFFASPWSPPAWMKTNKDFRGGHIRMEKDVLSAYAEYLIKYLRAYAEEGVHIDVLTPQNEFASDNNYPTCLWTGEEMRIFIKDYLGPALEKSDLSTKLYLGTINDSGTLGGFGSKYNDYTTPVLDDEDALQYIKGVAYQWEGKLSLRPAVESYPELDYMQSENECGDGTNTWEYACYVFELMRHYITGGVSAYCYWNPVLPRGGKSTWGWTQNSLFTTENGNIRPEYEHAVLKQASMFMKRGAKVLRIGGRMSGNCFGMQNPDGTIALMLRNPFPYPKKVCFLGESAALASDSVTTLLFEKADGESISANRVIWHAR